MKNVLCLLAFLSSSLFIQQIFSQTTTTNDDKDSDYFEMLQEYQRNKNRNLIPKTIQFLNAKDSLEEHEFEILVGFWGGVICRR